MRAEDLSGDDPAVSPVAELEGTGDAPDLPDVARRAGLDPERTRAAVSRRLSTGPGLLHGVADTGRTDLGPVCEPAPRT